MVHDENWRIRLICALQDGFRPLLRKVTVLTSPGKFKFRTNLYIWAIFDAVGAQSFDLWDFSRSTWITHSLADSIDAHAETAAYFLIRVTGVTRMPAVYEMIPVLEYHTDRALRIEAKGKQVDRDA